MPYITLPQAVFRRGKQLTFEDILNGETPSRDLYVQSRTWQSDTVTRFVQKVPDSFMEQSQWDVLAYGFDGFVRNHRDLYQADRKDLYHTFYIPKRTHGLRRIDAPNDALMNALRELQVIFEASCCELHHTSAFAYVRNRCTVDAIRRHQNNQSRWFLKTDFSDFFGSTTKDFLIGMLEMIFPFSEILKNEPSRENMIQALDLCFLNGGLPQGTPISPMLTNLMMIPIDHMLCNTLRKEGFVYTRYADDIQISHRMKFDSQQKVDFINEVLRKFGAPFSIKTEKTRFGSNSGRNWNLGVMLNKENQITIGYRNKKNLKAMCTNYILDRKNGSPWDGHDVMVLNGLLSYFKMVEPDYEQYMVRHLSEKFQADLVRALRDDIADISRGTYVCPDNPTV